MGGVRALEVVVRKYGDPLEALEVTPRDLPAPGSGEVLVRTLCTPIHPSDLNIIEGRYIAQPPVPFVPGREGIGEVMATGTGCHLAPGARVITPYRSPTCPRGWWATHRLEREEDLLEVSPSISNELAAHLTINPPTALLLLRLFGEPSKSSFVLQNAGTSDVARFVIQLAPTLGIRTATLVRTKEEAERLEALGADVVLTSPETLPADVGRATNHAEIKAAFDGLGDSSAAQMARCLAATGTVVTYGGMARTALQIPISTLIYGDIRFVGFMRTRWIDSHGVAAYRTVLQSILGEAERGRLTARVDSAFSIAEVRRAVARSLERGRRGKVLLST